MATPDLSTVIEAAIKYHLGELNTSIPARILKYDETKQEAEVQPLIKRRYKDGRVISRAPITGVPVIFPAAGGGIITFPVKVGDTVLLVFSQRSIDRWVRSEGGEVDPLDNRKHDISDAMAIPGLFTLNQALQSDPDNVIIKFSGASISLTPNGEVNIEAPGGFNVVGDSTIDGTLGVTGDVQFDSNLNVSGDIVANEVTGGGKVLSTHVHADQWRLFCAGTNGSTYLMPFDLKLEDGDVVVDPFDLQLNSKGLEAVGQRIAITLNTFKGEYFLNTEFGAPWLQTVFRKGVSKNLIDTQIKNVITAVPGVLQLLQYQSVINNTLREMSITFKARVDEGVIDQTINLDDIIQTSGGAILLESGDNLLQEDLVSLILQE